MFERYGFFVVRRARLLLIISAVAFAAAAVIGMGAFGKLQNGGFADPAAESARAQRLIEDNFGGVTNLVLLIRATEGTVDDPALAAAATKIATGLAGEPTVSDVVSYWQTRAPAMRSTDGRDALITAHVMGDDTTIVANTEKLLDAYGTDGPGYTVHAAGNAAVNVDVRTEVGTSLALAEGIAVPLTMLLLIVAFRSAIAALLPLAIGGLAIIGTFALLYVLGSVTHVSIFAINLTTAMGLGLAIDYALLLVSRFREQLTADPGDVTGAVVRTVTTAGRTIVFSAAAVAAALAALLVFPMFFLRSFAYAGVGVVIISAVAALVVVPALLTVLGPRVNKGRLPWARRDPGPSSRLWGRLAAAVMRRPALAGLPVLAALLVAASPLLGVTFGSPDEGALPPGSGSRVVAETLRESFPGNGNTLDVVTTGPVAEAAWAQYATALSRLPGVTGVQTASATFADGGAGPAAPGAANLASAAGQRLRVLTSFAPQSDAAQDLVRDVRALPGPAGASQLVGGPDAQLVDSKAGIGGRLPWALGLIVATTFVLLFLFTGSVVQPLRALVLGGLSMSATLGVMTWIFQDGHLASLLGFTPRPMDTSMTVLLFCIAFGLSMDYELFLTSRIKELHDQGAPTETAVSEGLARTGRIVTTAAGLLAVSFFAFGTSSVSFLQLFGLGTGLAILLDATVIRGVLVPATMRLLGRTAWWAPRPLRRVYQRVAISEA
ncbi:MMPL family transporter [Luedemannella helvata]|uniref:MMPL family transporter n=1 Tax=Luedemannella helvata TaxID=349315 RepID=A0ABN2L5Y2_9ACTN